MLSSVFSLTRTKKPFKQLRRGMYWKVMEQAESTAGLTFWNLCSSQRFHNGLEKPQWLIALTTLSPPLSFPGCVCLISPSWKSAHPPFVLWMIFLYISMHMAQDSRLAQFLNSWEIIIIFLCRSDSNPGPESCGLNRGSESQMWLLLNSGERSEGHVGEILRESNLDFSGS